MQSKRQLTQSQINALHEYISSNHLIINSGRCSGKSETLIEVFRFWLEYQMKNNDTCVIIGHSLRANMYFMDSICRLLEQCKIERFGSTGYKLEYNNKICYIKAYTSIANYFLVFPHIPAYGMHSSVTLILGDEKYISDDWCMNTACAFTQRRKVMTLDYKNNITEEMRILEQYKAELDNIDFEQLISNAFNNLKW